MLCEDTENGKYLPNPKLVPPVTSGTISRTCHIITSVNSRKDPHTKLPAFTQATQPKTSPCPDTFARLASPHPADYPSLHPWSGPMQLAPPHLRTNPTPEPRSSVDHSTHPIPSHLNQLPQQDPITLITSPDYKL